MIRPPSPRAALLALLTRLPAGPEQALAEHLERRWMAAGRVRWLRRMRDLRVARWQRLARARPPGLTACERRVWSQNGEDGILAELFRRLGPAERTFLEFGAGDGSENCTRHLVEAEGWSGAWLEGSAEAAARAAAAVAGRPVRVLSRHLTVDSLLPALAEAAVPPAPDLVVIDVDGNDAWLWRELARRHRPRVVVIEVNGSYPPGVRWVMPYDPGHVWRGTRHHGASLESLVDLGRELGYRLVAGDSAGVNAFFVRADLVGAFPGKGGAGDHYWPPTHHPLFFGHPPHREPADAGMGALPAGAEASLRLELLAPVPRRVPAGARFFLRARLANRGSVTLSGRPPHPFCLSYHWLDAAGLAPIVHDGIRTPLLGPLPGGARALLDVEVEAPPLAGAAVLHLTAVQEGVRWLESMATRVEVAIEPAAGVG